MQSETAFSPKPQRSRAPSPAPSNDKARRSSMSTDTSTDLHEDKQKKSRKNRRGSNTTTASDASFITSNATTVERLYANEKRNHDFHTLFRSVPDGERLIEDYGCALQKEILLQGRVYISEHHLCFNANIFGWITNLVIAFADIEDIEKRTTAIFIPNAILISTCSSKHFMASFLSRDHAFDQMVEIWKASRASKIEVHQHDKYNDDATMYSEDDSDYTSSSGYSYSEDEEDTANHLKSASANAIQDKPSLQDRQSSLASLPLPKHMISADEAARRRAVSEAGPRPNIQEYIKRSESATTTATIGNTTVANPTAPNVNTEDTLTTSVVQKPQIKEKTECECHKNDLHFPTIVMDNTYDTTIETMYNLLFDSPFMNKFLTEVEKSTEVNIGQWTKHPDNDIPLCRESSYIKYLGGSIGPKSTKCHLKEDILHLDTTDYVSQLTVTQTPDVPSGGSFSVKTRTCISWCGQGQVRVLVTVLVDFTKSSWLKSTIEKASIDGQQNYYKSLDAAVRKYLDQQQESNKTSRKKGGKRRHHKQRGEKQHVEPVVSEQPQNYPMLSNALNWLIENASVPSTSQLTALCMMVIVLTNLYIAAKIGRVDKQLLEKFHSVEPLQHRGYQYQRDELDQNSLWRMLSKLDPDARKEDLAFIQRTREPIQQQNFNSNVEGDYDEHLQFSQLNKVKLDKQMMELEKMIQKAGQTMEQVTHVVQNQRKRILNPDM